MLEKNPWGIIQLMYDVLKKAELIKDELTVCPQEIKLVSVQIKAPLQPRVSAGAGGRCVLGFISAACLES